MESLEEQNVGGAAVINSSISAGKQEELLEDLEQGDLEYMFPYPGAVKQTRSSGTRPRSEAVALRDR